MTFSRRPSATPRASVSHFQDCGAGMRFADSAWLSVPPAQTGLLANNAPGDSRVSPGPTNREIFDGAYER